MKGSLRLSRDYYIPTIIFEIDIDTISNVKMAMKYVFIQTLENYTNSR